MNRILLAAIGIAAIAAAIPAAAHDYPGYSEWSTTYVTAEGHAVQSHVTLYGDRGSYHTDRGARGWLYAIDYRPAVHEAPDVTLVTGTWKYETGQTGWFKFHFNASWTRFSGIWGFSGSRTAYPWNGRRAAVEGVGESPAFAGPARPSRSPVDSRPPSFSPSPLRPNFGGGRPSGGPPTIGDAGQLPGGTQLKFENGQLKAFDSRGRFLGNVRQ